VYSKVNSSQQCILAAVKANCVPGCTSKNAESRTREVIIPLYLALVRPNLEYRVQFWCSEFKREIEKLATAL